MKASGATAPAAPASTSAEAALDALDALDARARAVYETVRDAVTAHGYPPSMREIGAATSSSGWGWFGAIRTGHAPSKSFCPSNPPPHPRPKRRPSRTPRPPRMLRALRPPSAPRILAASILRTPMTFLRCPCCPA